MLHPAGGSTHKQNDTSLAGGRIAGPVLRIGILLAAAAALAACESFAVRALGSASALSPRASSAVRENFVSLSAPPAWPDARPGADARIDVLLRPEIQLETLPARPGDLLRRLRDSFSLTAANDAAYKRELEYFASHTDYVERVVNRASPYLYYIADEIYRRGMPAELALLPIVESAFDPFAYSRGRAAGLWQIIPGTGRRLGVKQNWWFDGRRDLIESTRAALDYLQELHEQFGGDWLLAVAGYNSGEGNVADAIEQARKAGRRTDFWGIRPYLPKETRTYVPRLLAICSLIANPERYDLELPVVPDVPQLAIVDTGGQIDMALAAKLAGLDVDALYRLNPGVNRWATDPSGPHRLVVPIANAEEFREGLAALGNRERVEWTRRKIEEGDTLIGLAAEYHTTPAVLREVNGLRGNAIRAGDYIMIPRAARPGDGAQIASSGKRDAAATPASLAKRADASEDRIRRVNYVVRGGDSLYSIATRFRVSVEQILEWNDGLSIDRYLQPGDRLVMFVDVAEQST